MARGDTALDASVAGIEYKLIRRKGMRSIRMRVTEPDGVVVVSAGMRRSRAEIDRFVAERGDWIARSRARIARMTPRFPAHYDDGDEFSLWGSPMVLRVRAAAGRRCSSRLGDGELVVSVPSGATREDVEGAFKGFLRKELKKALETVVPRCEAMAGIECAGVQIRDMSSRWGSCTSSTRKIRIALKLALYPPECLEMVMVHELAHIRHRGHDRDFYAFMDAHYPRWREANGLLRE